MSDHAYPVTFPADGPVDVSVRQHSGETIVTALDTTEVSVDLRASGPDADQIIDATTVDFRAGALHIEVPKTPSSGLQRASVDISVTVPRASALDLQSGSGKLVMDGEFAAVTAKSGSGDISVDSCTDAELKAGSGSVVVRTAQSVTASTGSGDITVDVAGGRAELSTGSGDVELTGAVGSGSATTGSGDVTVSVLDGSFEVKAVSGDVTIRRAVAGELRVKTVSGDVEVGIAAGTAAHLDVSSVSGRVRSGLDEADGPGDSDHKLMLSARTVSGHITLERRP